MRVARGGWGRKGLAAGTAKISSLRCWRDGWGGGAWGLVAGVTSGKVTRSGRFTARPDHGREQRHGWVCHPDVDFVGRRETLRTQSEALKEHPPRFDASSADIVSSG